MTTAAPRLSRVRTFLFGALAVVWFSEMVLWGFQSFSKVWTSVWNIIPPENPQLATALYITHAVEAPAKGALGVMAVFGLMSRNPSARTALLASMSLVPPLNIAFQFRAQGFPLRSTMVATVFSTILWASFLLFKESGQQLEQEGSPSRWDVLQYVWFAVSSAALTLTACLFLFGPRSALNVLFPCLSDSFAAQEGELSSLVLTSFAVGTHLLALATASWIATVRCRTNPTLRRAVTVASTAHAGLLLVFPLRQLVLDVGGSCATSSVVVLAVPLLVGWVLYAAFSYRVRPRRLRSFGAQP